MFKSMRNLLLAVMMVCICLCIPVFAVTVATMGAPDSSGNYPIVVDSDNYVTFNGGVYSKYELATTNDTLTAAESGKTIVVKQATDATSDTVTLVLPSTAVGLSYTIVSADDETIYIDPATADIIRAETIPLNAGDRLTSPGATGDSVTLICATAGYWDVVTISGDWTDGD